MSDATITPDEQLFTEVKSYLHITWQDDNTDANIKSYINSSKSRLQEIAGGTIDFEEDSLAKDLLKDRCRYMNAQALEMFEKNFASELLELHFKYQFETPEKLTVISAVGSKTGQTIIKVSPQLNSGNTYMYKLGTSLNLPSFFDVCDSVCGYTSWNGIDEITANSGDDVLIVEVDENFKAIRAGKTVAVVS